MSAFVPLPPGSDKFINVNAAGSTQVKTSPGSLQSIVIGEGAEAATLALYDGTSASGIPITTLDASTTRWVQIGVQFNEGLYAVLVGAANATIVYS